MKKVYRTVFFTAWGASVLFCWPLAVVLSVAGLTVETMEESRKNRKMRTVH